MPVEVVDNVELPDSVQQGAQTIIDDPIDIITGDSGLEARRQHSPDRRIRRYQIEYRVYSKTEMYAVQKLYDTNGRTIGFLHHDWADDTATAENIGTGDGSTLTFNLTKTSITSARSLVRRITRPVSTGLTIYVDGVASIFASVGALGVVTFTMGHAPASGKAVTWTGTYRIPVRFDSQLNISATTEDCFSLNASLKELFET